MSRTRHALALTAALAAVLVGCGDDRTSMRDFCASHGGGPISHSPAPAPGDGTTVICKDDRLRFIKGDVKP